jgi:hypothetical protein
MPTAATPSAALEYIEGVDSITTGVVLRRFK